MAMENGSLSASDVALLSGSNGFGGFAGGFEGLIYLAVIAAMFGGGFGFIVSGLGLHRGARLQHIRLKPGVASRDDRGAAGSFRGCTRIAKFS